MTRSTVRLIGLPTDANSSYLRGPAKAPGRIRSVLFSDMSNAAAESGREIGRDFALQDAGDLPLTGNNQDDDARIESAVAQALREQCVPLLLGGDHAVTYPVLRAVAAHYGPVDILHIDAHPDLYESFQGNRRSHASPFARIMEDRLARRLVQVGIRTLNAEQTIQVERFGVEIVPMRAFSVEAVPSLRGPVYVSIDLDGLDPAHAPGVSHHEPGGLTVRQTLEVLWRIDAPVIGADIVEYNPDRDINDMTAVVAAKLLKELAALATSAA
jgi:agmatinase